WRWTTSSRLIFWCAPPEIWPGAWPTATLSFGKSWSGARSCMKKLTADWVRKAESDYRVAGKLARSRPPENDFVCFCCQQAAEKYLKALLVEVGLAVPRTHNLEDLLGLLRPHHPGLFALRRGLVFLTRFAVDVR